jgi:hypothetical protein
MPQLGDENAITQRDLRMSFTTSATEAWYLHPRLKTRSASALPCSSGFGDIGVDQVTYRKGISSGFRLGWEMVTKWSRSTIFRPRKPDVWRLNSALACTRAKPGTFEEGSHAVLDQYHAYPLSCTCRADTRNHIFPQHEIGRRTSDTGVPS